ncbi:MAG: hypothetical protein INQ03_22185 [Candidatus Heimdallarchaeota archaeon]|nr:hypothetical protein [Candidatus Heimdallarchaeota archaeon]
MKQRGIDPHEIVEIPIKRFIAPCTKVSDSCEITILKKATKIKIIYRITGNDEIIIITAFKI